LRVSQANGSSTPLHACASGYGLNEFGRGRAPRGRAVNSLNKKETLMRSNRRVADVVARLVAIVCLGGYVCEAKAEPPPEKEIALDLGDGAQMEFTLIPAGEFMMGSHESPADVVKTFDLPEIFVVYLKNEHPQHRVRITKAFYLGKYEVTQQQWQTIMGTNPSYSKGPKHPVETVNWNECQAFINKLDEKSGRPGVKFSLPTEAQWEYACRAETSTRFSFGDDKASLGEYVWYGRNSDKQTHPVGQMKPNAWGLYDMHGNVTEWCADWYDEGYYKQSPPNDPTGPSEGTSRVLRGGSFYDDLPDYFRCADRYHDHPGYHYYRYGFRVAGIVAP
jgi:formylglycine-generating enzyme required for sulfatase activity